MNKTPCSAHQTRTHVARLTALTIITGILVFGAHAENFTWKNVEIGSGGFDCGIQFHPKKQGLMFCRSDVCGAHKWNSTSGRWVDLLASVWNYKDEVSRGGVGLAIDPEDTNTVYVSRFGLRQTTDGGRTWKTLTDKYCGNNMREHGEPIAVDPLNTAVIYYATANEVTGGWATAVAVRKGTEDVLVAGTDKDGRKMARSTRPVSANGWTVVQYVTMQKVQPWFKMKYWSYLGASDMAFDPFKPNSAVFGDCFALWRTDDVWTKGTDAANPVVWTSIPWGNENT